ncbi:hypothetical protein QF036_002482 [Arthrobacter globiformis]|nr:hypothetical protein [Arthrobacter globiformis]
MGCASHRIRQEQVIRWLLLVRRQTNAQRGLACWRGLLEVRAWTVDPRRESGAKPRTLAPDAPTEQTGVAPVNVPLEGHAAGPLGLYPEGA